MPRFNVQHPVTKEWRCFSAIVDDYVTDWMDEERYQKWRLYQYGRNAGEIRDANLMDYEEAEQRIADRKQWDAEDEEEMEGERDMSKYIIDLRPDCKVVQQICVSDDNVGVGARSVELFDALTDDYVKENFKDLLEGEYQRGLEEGKKATFGLVADASNAEYQKGFEDGKAVNNKGCDGCKYIEMGSDTTICAQCCNAYYNKWTAKDTYYDIIRNSIHNWVTELNVKLEDISKVLEDMKHD